MAKRIDKQRFRIVRKEVTSDDWLFSRNSDSSLIGAQGYFIQQKSLLFWSKLDREYYVTQEKAERALASYITQEVERAAFLKANPDGVVAYASLMEGFERL